MIDVNEVHFLEIVESRCYLFSKLTYDLIRELDEYETQLVLAAYKEGVIDGKNSGC
jgi:hypothetical protein